MLHLFFAGMTLLGPTSLAASAGTDTNDAGWVTLIGPAGHELTAWKTPTTGWDVVADTAQNPSEPKRLVGKEGEGAIYNGPGGRAGNLVSRESYGDVEVHLEFMVPKGSNSGIKLEAVYEVQIFDSFGVKKPKASDCGGIYPRAELLPRYHHIDEGYPPLRNASRAPGEWQTLEIVFLSPKFDAEGKKSKNAKFVKVVLNGEIVQENLELPCPTGNNWRNKEHTKGPILLQGDHGPVAFRNLRVRPIEGQ